jgi:hypothetical protein
MSEENDDDMENPEDDTDAYEFIAEDEDMDDIIPVEGIPTGEDLMGKYCSVTTASPEKESKGEAAPVEEGKETVDPAKPLTRPASPAVAPDARQNLPSEMRSRPKIPRTPVNNIRAIKPKAKVDIQVPVDDNEQVAIAPRSPTPQGTQGQFEHAFKPRNKIRRTPK